MDKAHKAIDNELDRIERRLTEVYSQAQKELSEKADAFLKKFEAESDKRLKLVEQGKMTDKQYQDWAKKKIMSGKRFTEMKEQCAAQVSHVNEVATDYINDKMPQVYSLGYNAVENDTKQLKGYTFHAVSQDTVKNLALSDKSLVPMKVLDPAKDIPWNMKAINSEILQGILQGESVSDMSKRIFGYTTHTGTDMGEILHKNQVAAVRTARTMATSAENKGRQDSYDRLTNDGVIIEKEWFATLDSRVRDSHRLLDGEIVPEDEEFSNGLMYPADPDGDPEEVYNCRCSMAAHVKGFVSKST